MKILQLTIAIGIGCNLAFSQSSDLFNYDQSKTRNAEIVSKQSLDSLTSFEKIVLEGHNSKIPFYHYKNSRSQTKGYVILLHGLGDSKEDWVNPSEPYLDWSRNTKAIKDSLLQLGYHIIIPDAKFHGERSYELGFRSPTSLPPIISQNEKDTKLFEDMMTGTVKDLRIIMDYFGSRNQNSKVDFKAIGYSMGGNLAILLSMFDSRVSSVVACVPPLNLPARGLEQFDWSEVVLQGQLNITPMTYASIQKAPLLLLMGKKDFYTTANEVEQFFNQVPGTNKSLKYFDAGHILPDEYGLDAIAWLQKWTSN